MQRSAVYHKFYIIFVHGPKSTFITTYSGTKANFGPISHEFMETILSYCQEEAVHIFSFLPSLALTVYVISEAFSFLILSVLQFQAVSFLIMRCINHTNTHRDVSLLALPHSHANVSWQRMARRPHYSGCLSGRRMQEIRT